jgi:hypothetical protein
MAWSSLRVSSSVSMGEEAVDHFDPAARHEIASEI